MIVFLCPTLQMFVSDSMYFSKRKSIKNKNFKKNPDESNCLVSKSSFFVFQLFLQLARLPVQSESPKGGIHTGLSVPKVQIACPHLKDCMTSKNLTATQAALHFSKGVEAHEQHEHLYSQVQAVW